MCARGQGLLAKCSSGRLLVVLQLEPAPWLPSCLLLSAPHTPLGERGVSAGSTQRPGGCSAQARPRPPACRVGPPGRWVLGHFLAVGSPLLTYRPQAPEGGQPCTPLLLTCSPHPCHRHVRGAGGPGWPAWGPRPCSPAAPELWALGEIRTPQC